VAGLVTKQQLAAAARRIIAHRFNLGLFNDPTDHPHVTIYTANHPTMEHDPATSGALPTTVHHILDGEPPTTTNGAVHLPCIACQSSFNNPTDYHLYFHVELKCGRLSLRTGMCSSSGKIPLSFRTEMCFSSGKIRMIVEPSAASRYFKGMYADNATVHNVLHARLAREAAQQGVVVVQNPPAAANRRAAADMGAMADAPDTGRLVLPLSASAKYAIVGPLANITDPFLGDYRPAACPGPVSHTAS
jgi:beta-glucosidase-like glycosyl hydrolase